MLSVDRDFLINELEKLFPNAHCELIYKDVYELSVAVILSAQTSDASVNKVTPNLFKEYPTLTNLANASYDNVYRLIESLGLAKRKAEYLIKFAKTVLDDFNGVIPKTIEELVTIPGIGRKTANVIISEGYGLPGLAVDVHVTRVSKRLGLATTKDDPKRINSN